MILKIFAILNLSLTIILIATIVFFIRQIRELRELCKRTQEIADEYSRRKLRLDIDNQKEKKPQ